RLKEVAGLSLARHIATDVAPRPHLPGVLMMDFPMFGGFVSLGLAPFIGGLSPAAFVGHIAVGQAQLTLHGGIIKFSFGFGDFEAIGEGPLQREARKDNDKENG